jgi:hypothetical protein
MIKRWGKKIAAHAEPRQPSVPRRGQPDQPNRRWQPVEPPVEMDRMTDLTDGNQDQLRELVEMYLKQTSKQFAQMETAIRDGNAEVVRQVAHSCAGASATLGMTTWFPNCANWKKSGLPALARRG